MAPSATQQVLLSPAELSYLHTSLSYNPPIRPDGRISTQFRPLVAESDILPGTNGSARICFADGTEAIVGIKAEVEKIMPDYRTAKKIMIPVSVDGHEDKKNKTNEKDDLLKRGLNEWVELTVEIPGFRSDDSMPVFLAAMLSEALLADGEFTKGLWINRRFHWKLYIDILLLSQRLSYPLPLLSLTTHLALLSTRLPKLKSELDEDPFFDDDWDASVFLYPRTPHGAHARPPITLLVMAVKDNIIFDPSKEELAVAEVAIAVSVSENTGSGAAEDAMDTDTNPSRELRLLSVRTVDPPSRMSHPGVPNTFNTATGGSAASNIEQQPTQRETMDEEGVWQPPRGGAKRTLIAAMIQKVLEPKGVAEEVLDGLNMVELG